MDGCILWDKGLHRDGYGLRKLNGKTVLAHRAAYCEAHGLSLSAIGGQVVRHTCDIPRCVNPAHLVLGSQTDNMRDMITRGRDAKAKLSPEQVRYIREVFVPRHKEYGGAALGRRFGVTQATISRLVHGRAWKYA